MALRHHSAIFAAVLALVISGCSDGGNASMPADAVASVGKNVLTASHVRTQIPAGVTPDDSAGLAKAYIRSWVTARLVENVAARDVDMEEIDRLTAEYRSELIMAQYRRLMAANDPGIFSEDSLRAFYDRHTADFRLERPLIKGVYLKVPDDAKNLKLIRRLYNSERPADIDRLEKAANSTAIHYDYFRDSWVDWEQIETRIPLEFSADRLARIGRHQPLDISAQGFVYLLSVNDVLPAGAAMPFEAARPLVRERLLALKRRAYDKALLNGLYEQSVADGTAVIYDAAPSH